MTLSDIFVSYSRRDSTFVEQLTKKLHKAGLDVWIDWEDIPYSSNWWEEISQAVTGAPAFVCVLTDDYFKSETCRAELKLAEEANKRIIPVCYKDFDRTLNNSNAIAKTNWLAFATGDNFDASFEILLDTLARDCRACSRAFAEALRRIPPLRQNGAGIGFTSADAILPKGREHSASCLDMLIWRACKAAADWSGLRGEIGRALNKFGDVIVQRDAILIAQIHHVPGAVVIQLDVLLQFGRQTEVRHGKFGREKRRRHVVVPVFYLHQQSGIGEHRLREVVLRVRRAREAASSSSSPAACRARPVPASSAAAVVVLFVLAEFQLIVVVHVEQRRECAAYRRAFRVALRRLRQQVSGVAGEARVNAAAGQPAAAQQLDVELTERGPQVRLQQIFFAQPREVRELLRHGRLLRCGQGAALVERVGVLVLRVLARLFDELV